MSLKNNVLKWAKTHQKRDGQSWNGYCQSLMWRLCDYYGKAPDPTPSSATVAASRAFTKYRNPYAAKAPAGAFHYWELDGTSFGHVALDLTGGGKELFMASRHVTKTYGDALGTISMQDYLHKTGAKYQGWSYWNGLNGYVAKPPKR